MSGGNVPWHPVEITRTDDSVHPSGRATHRQKVVATFNRLYPGMSVLELCEKGKVRFSQLKVGREGACVNFGLFGRCSGCQYRHEVCTVVISQQATIVKVLEGALARIKASAWA